MRSQLMIIALLLSCCTVFAQQLDKTYTQLNAGLVLPLLDNGAGVHFGVNPCLPLGDIVHLEGQLSMSYTDISGAFISGEESTETALNALIGGRVYLTKSDKKLRPYVNLLMGVNPYWETRNTASGDVKTNGVQAGLSTGVYVMSTRGWSAGLALETPGAFILKVGYAIGR